MKRYSIFTICYLSYLLFYFFRGRYLANQWQSLLAVIMLIGAAIVAINMIIMLVLAVRTFIPPPEGEEGRKPQYRCSYKKQNAATQKISRLFRIYILSMYEPIQTKNKTDETTYRENNTQNQQYPGSHLANIIEGSKHENNQKRT